MANKFYLISRSDFGPLLAKALQERYVDAVIHYSNDDQVIFSCPSVSDKVLSVYKEQQYHDGDEYFDKLAVSYGDAWTSGTTITNPVPFCGNARKTSAIDAYGYIEKAQVILGDSFILINFECSRDQMAIMGKLTNGKYVCLGFNYESGHCAETHGYITEGNIGEILIPTVTEPFKDDLRHVLMPVIFSLNGSSVLKNADGTFATIPGLYNIPNINGTKTYQPQRCNYSTTTFITRSRYMYNVVGQAMLHTPLFCEIEMA